MTDRVAQPPERFADPASVPGRGRTGDVCRDDGTVRVLVRESQDGACDLIAEFVAVADRPAQKLGPERERVLGGRHESCAHRLLNRGEQRGRRLAEHFGRVLQPERGAKDRRRHQQAPGASAQAAEPLPSCERHPPR